MNEYGNGHLIENTGLDIQAMVNAAQADEPAPLSSMLAKAMLYSQDADRKLESARAAKQKAAKYRAEIQKNTIAETEVYCAELRAEADRHFETARQTREEAEQSWESARAELQRAAKAREEADAYTVAAREQAEEHRRSVYTEAEHEAIGIRSSAREDAQKVMAEEREKAEREIQHALTSLEKMQSAVQAELEAQQMYTDAARFRAASPKSDEEVDIPLKPATRRTRKAA